MRPIANTVQCAWLTVWNARDCKRGGVFFEGMGVAGSIVGMNRSQNIVKCREEPGRVVEQALVHLAWWVLAINYGLELEFVAYHAHIHSGARLLYIYILCLGNPGQSHAAPRFIRTGMHDTDRRAICRTSLQPSNLIRIYIEERHHGPLRCIRRVHIDHPRAQPRPPRSAGLARQAVATFHHRPR